MMSALRTVLALVLLAAAAAPAVSAMQPLPERQEQYVPLDQLPPQEQMAAAPLLITAYVVDFFSDNADEIDELTQCLDEAQGDAEERACQRRFEERLDE